MGPFSGCTNLTEIDVDAGNTKYTSQDGVLYNKDKTTLITYPEGKIAASFIIPNSVTGIFDSAFRDCTSLTGITIPNSVTSIGTYAFYGCTGLTGITIPNGVTSIGTYAFYGCTKLRSVTFAGGGVTLGANTFLGDLATKYNSEKAGTYTTTDTPVKTTSTWTKSSL